MSASLGDLMEAVATEGVANVKTMIPGEVVSYDPRRRLALVKAKARLIKVGADGNDEEKPIPNAWMHVAFHESGGFIVASDVEVGDKGRIYYSHAALEQWKKTGSEVGVVVGKFDETDAVFVPGFPNDAHPGVEIPRGQMIVGAENGPRTTFDRTALNYEVRAYNTASIAATRIVLQCPEGLIVNGVRLA